MLKHKKNCKENLVTIQHRNVGGGNGAAGVLHRLYCPNCKNSYTLNPKEAIRIVPLFYAPTETK